MFFPRIRNGESVKLTTQASEAQRKRMYETVLVPLSGVRGKRLPLCSQSRMETTRCGKCHLENVMRHILHLPILNVFCLWTGDG
jgi:hypothetical protein